MRFCQHCKIGFDLHHRPFASHVRWCFKNPNLDLYLKKINDKKIKIKGILKNYDVNCYVCKQQFSVEEHEKEHPKKEKYFCNIKCANSLGGKAKSDRFFREGKLSYRSICFRYYEKKCIICGFDKVVAVHHLDENRLNNSPDNLIPLCPNHHAMVHMKNNVNEMRRQIKKNKMGL